MRLRIEPQIPAISCYIQVLLHTEFRLHDGISGSVLYTRPESTTYVSRLITWYGFHSYIFSYNEISVNECCQIK